jgi:hypothetical protein
VLRIFFNVFVLLFSISSSLLASDMQSHHHDSQVIAHHHEDTTAPIGIMGEHIHKAGEWMTSYRYMRMDMNNSYSGSNQISDNDIFSDFMIAPTEMSMEMHMVGIMYAPTDEITMMLMLPYLSKSMDHTRRTDGVQFNAEANGLGDIELSGLLKLVSKDNHVLNLNLGLSFPTGSIDEHDETLLGPHQKLPYPMQLGSGTFDLHPGLTYTGNLKSFSWGVQPSLIVRLEDKSDNEYRLGNRYELTAWGAYKIRKGLSSSLRLAYAAWEDIEGVDSDLNPNMVQTANVENSGGERLDILWGFTYYPPEGTLKGHRFALEVGVPIYQNLNGPQLGVDFQGTVGWQKVF